LGDYAGGIWVHEEVLAEALLGQVGFGPSQSLNALDLEREAEDVAGVAA